MSEVDEGVAPGCTTGRTYGARRRTVKPPERADPPPIKPPGVDRLRAWGLLDELVATTPVILDRTYWLDDEPHAAHPPADGRHALAPRRTVLDPLLLDAA